MAWAPSTNFEDDLVDLQPDFNLIHGQLAYDLKRKEEFTPRPKSTYDYLERREKRNKEIDKVHGVKSKEIRASLAMMERIQAIAGTKPLGEHATMSDWEDTSTVEKEAIAMMRHFGFMSMSDGTLEPPRNDHLPEGPICIVRNGRRAFPLIMDPNYFEPGKTRKPSADSCSFNFTTSNQTTSSEIYASAKSHLNDTASSVDSQSYVEIPYQLLQETSNTPEPDSSLKLKQVKKKQMNRPMQSQRKWEK